MMNMWVLLRQDGPAYVDTLLTVLRNVTKEETVQYVLALLDDIVTGQAAGWNMPEQRTVYRISEHIEVFGSTCVCLLCANISAVGCIIALSSKSMGG